MLILDLGVLVAILLNCGLSVAVIVLTLILWKTVAKLTPEMKKSISVVPTCMDPLQKSEIPIAVICAIANHFHIPLQEIAQEYVKDWEQRRSIVLANFRQDALTKYFVNKYPSKFLAHGYIGEEMLVEN